APRRTSTITRSLVEPRRRSSGWSRERHGGVAKSRRSLAGPAPEGAMKRTWVLVTQRARHGADGSRRAGQKRDGVIAADLIGQRPIFEAQAGQPSLERARRQAVVARRDVEARVAAFQALAEIVAQA